MFWRLMPHASACIASGKLFVLDARQDRYFQVPQRAAAPMRDWLEQDHPCAAPDEVRTLFERSGILRPGDAPPTNVLAERADIPASLSAPATTQMAPPRPIRLASTIAATWLELRARPLWTILSNRALRQPVAARGNPEAIAAEAAMYERLRRFTPIARNCLLDSLALDGWLARHGLRATLVFGVTAIPFAAHCWLQTSDVILNDSVDHVSRFTPILAQ